MVNNFTDERAYMDDSILFFLTWLHSRTPIALKQKHTHTQKHTSWTVPKIKAAPVLYPEKPLPFPQKKTALPFDRCQPSCPAVTAHEGEGAIIGKFNGAGN